jgi:hypothetical protein
MKASAHSSEVTAQPIAQDFRSSLFYDETTKEKIARHLTDINDRISEEDIRNIDTNITKNTNKGNKATSLPHLAG